jgi:pyridoxal phosphate enzyme (YggS family)
MLSPAEIRATLADRLRSVHERIAAAGRRAGRDPAGVRLVAVTKTVGPRVAALLPELGVLDLGETRPQEMWKKAAALPAARWHLVGHLQRNKVERTLPLVHLIHSVDSLRLLDALNDAAGPAGQRFPILLQFNISHEATKHGFVPDDVPALARTVLHSPFAEAVGVMGMAAYADVPEASRPAFVLLRRLRDQLRDAIGHELSLPELSMGMSNDFEVAVEEGATIVRLGTTLFEGLEDEG